MVRVNSEIYVVIFQKKIQEVFSVVQKGVLRDVQQTLERKKLATARDNMGRCPLHTAVLTENNYVVEYIAKSFPATVKCKDHVSHLVIIIIIS